MCIVGYISVLLLRYSILDGFFPFIQISLVSRFLLEFPIGIIKCGLWSWLCIVVYWVVDLILAETFPSIFLWVECNGGLWDVCFDPFDVEVWKWAVIGLGPCSDDGWWLPCGYPPQEGIPCLPVDHLAGLLEAFHSSSYSRHEFTTSAA